MSPDNHNQATPEEIAEEQEKAVVPLGPLAMKRAKEKLVKNQKKTKRDFKKRNGGKPAQWDDIRSMVNVIAGGLKTLTIAATKPAEIIHKYKEFLSEDEIKALTESGDTSVQAINTLVATVKNLASPYVDKEGNVLASEHDEFVEGFGRLEVFANTAMLEGTKIIAPSKQVCALILNQLKDRTATPAE